MSEPLTLNIEARRLVVERLETQAPAMLQTIATAQGLTIEAIRETYRAKETRRVYPNYEVTPPQGRITEVGSRSITAEVDMWAIATVSMQSPTARDKACEVHMAALLSVLTAESPDGIGFAWQMVPIAFDTSPPGVEDNDQVQSVGVQVRVTIIEAR